MERMEVLHTKARLSSDGGTTFLLNNAKELKEEVRFDFLLYNEEGNDWAWKFEEFGSEINIREVRAANWFWKRIKCLRVYYRFFKENPYKIMHIDTDTVKKVDILLCAWLCGVPKRIYHSHNSRSEGGGRFEENRIMHKFMQWMIARLATDLLACSTEAAEWMFPQRCLQNVKIINNGIEIERFKFNSKDRRDIRNKYRLEDCYVIGCIGRFSKQKNHTFLLDTFAEVVKKNACARLLLIGEGELKDDIQKKTKDLQLEGKVIFVGAVDDVGGYLSAMDIYVMPSLFEGLGIAFIEAQANGLYCLASDSVSAEAKITEHMEFIPLNAGSVCWTNRILAKDTNVPLFDREVAWEDVENASYDIKDASEELLKIYEGTI